MKIHAAVGLAVLVVLVLAYFVPSDDTVEIVWTLFGAGGSVYAGHVFKRRWDAERWRQRQGMNGLFALTTQAHVMLRGLGFLGQLLILAGGLGAMLNWHRLVVIGSLIALAAVATFSCWYAERMADRQADYYIRHPEE